MRLFARLQLSGDGPVVRSIRLAASVVLAMVMMGAAVVGFLVLAAQATRT